MTTERRPDLSIVIPAFNEASRLPTTLQSINNYVETSTQLVEVVVVDDGSDDDTLTIARGFRPNSGRYRVISAPHRGKAAAVRTGVLEARGVVILFTDADLSTPIEYVDALQQTLDAGADIAIGSREGTGARRVGEPRYRHLMGRVFNGLVRILAVPGIDDTQCGFKAFRFEVAHDIFGRAKLYTDNNVIQGPRVTGFDVEILYLARRSGYRIMETPVYWEHVSGSKVRPMSDSARMVADVLKVRYLSARGSYD